MNSNQRSQGNNQSDNGGNELDVSSSRAGTADKNNLGQQHQQSGSLNSGSQQGGSDQHIGQQSTDRSGSQTGSQQQQSNDVAGGPPKSHGGKKLAADQDMDDDTGLSNRGNRQSAQDIDEGSRQEEQSNVGRRSDMTPD